MFVEIVAAGLILMLVWWLFKSGVIWPLLAMLVAGIVILVIAASASTLHVFVGY